eukprot:scaffold117875_cov60-Phaeocystis_antarctica.AAC.4
MVVTCPAPPIWGAARASWVGRHRQAERLGHLAHPLSCAAEYCTATREALRRERHPRLFFQTRGQVAFRASLCSSGCSPEIASSVLRLSPSENQWDGKWFRAIVGFWLFDFALFLLTV